MENMYERGSRNDGIPNDVAYPDLTYENKLELNEKMERECNNMGRRLSRLTGGELVAEDSADELQYHIYAKMRELAVQKTNTKTTYNVVGYLRTCISNKYRDMLDKFYDERAMQAQLRVKLESDHLAFGDEDPEEDTIRREEEDRAAKMAADYVKVITAAAKKLKTPIDEDDWVVTALNAINVGIHRKKLKGPLLLKLDEIRMALEKQGYRTRSSKEIKVPRGQGITRILEKMVNEKPLIGSQEAIDILEDRGIPHNKNSVKVLLCRIRYARGISLLAEKRKGNESDSLLFHVRDICAADIWDIREVQDELMHRGVRFKPSTVRNYIRMCKEDMPE